MSSDPPARRVVRKNYDYLVNELRVSKYLDAFFQEEVIDAQDKEGLQKKRNRYKQARYFVDILLGKPEEIIKKFFEIMKTKTDVQPHIYRRLFPDGTSITTTKLYARSSQQKEPPKSSKWKEPVIALDCLQPSGFLTDERYKHLQQRYRESEQSQWLLHGTAPLSAIF